MTETDAEFIARMTALADRGAMSPVTPTIRRLLEIIERLEKERDDAISDGDARVRHFQGGLDVAIRVYAQWMAALKDVASAKTERDAALAKVKVLTEALKPFSRLADEIEDCCRVTPDAPHPSAWSKACQWNDLQNARAAISAKE